MNHTHTFFLAFILFTVAIGSINAKSSVQKLQSGKIYFQVKQTPSSSPEPFQFSYDSSIKTEIKLTQSSKIQVQAKLKFTSELFDPQIVALRLINEKNDLLTEPVQLLLDSQSQSFKGIVDFGDPKTIKPYSDLYKLQLMIADQKLENNIRNEVAKIRVAFRYSMSQSQLPSKQSSIVYQPQSIIENPPPESRIDPPQTFTTFILILMATYSAIFLFGAFSYLKVNFNNFPTKGFGFLLNLVLLGLIIASFVFLMKFWLTWNFITTVHNFFWLILITAFVANYALHHIKNRDQTYSKQIGIEQK